ncbi:MAG: DNA mismatch repair protein MutL [Verrucomicrobia subdivision 3 bacterium]|nr:DNA mismatch repair protein MutL [Limisphaerales bacterium]MCS1413867.1 DNA mismatch repair protein MutL [Limisphaerales bacterium]
MQRIRLLSEKVANQIAAGEVVERPASIVKELVENAIDASATRIRVEIEAGGRSLIRVTDDGIGMGRDDALLALERHATSKIREATDLASIQSMGFRGEALPSISSISCFRLTTRERDSDDPDGTQILINGGKIIKVQSGTGATGTCIEVRNVFYNLPARRKFLRTAETERSHIHHYLHLIALAYPQIGFTYQHAGKTLWQLPPLNEEPSPDAKIRLLTQRYRALNANSNNMLRLQAEDVVEVKGTNPETEPVSEQPIRLWGLIGTPGTSRSTRSDQHLFVNQRPVENRGLNRALIEGCHTSLMKGRYPVCCLFLELDPRLVDVNVHPSKKEIKFRNEFGVRRFVSEAVRNCLLEFGRSLEPGFSTPTPSKPVRPVQSDVPRPGNSIAASDAETQPQAQTAAGTLPQSAVSGSAGAVPASASSLGIPRVTELNLPATPESAPTADAVAARTPTGIPAMVQPTPLLQVPLRLVGVIGKLYAIFESDRGMVLMEQHAAHERILFEQMMKRMESGAAPSQRLLLPETLELSARDAQFLKEQLKTLCQLGMGISEFGDQTFLLDALPPFVKVRDARQFTLEVIDQLKRSGESINTIRLGEDVITKTVCRHAVKANDSLHDQELEQLLADLRVCDMPYTCPHGRPTLIEMSYQALEKKFGRVQ